MKLRQRTLALLRGINRALLDFSYRRRLPFVLGLPSGIMFEPFSGCNYSCPLCPAGMKTLVRRQTEMSFGEFKRYLGVMKWTADYITLYHFGEPLLSRDLADIVGYCKKYDISVQISTNGSIYKEEVFSALFRAGLDRLIISIDTPRAERYGFYRRGGSFPQVEENVRKMVALKKRLSSDTRIVMQYLLMRGNEDPKEMQEHGERLGADEVLIKTIGIGTSVEDIASAKEFLPENEAYSRYSKVSGHEVVAKCTGFVCEYVWKRMLVCSDGTCTICVRDQKNEQVVGDLKKQGSLLRVWNGKAYRKVRTRARTEIIYPPMCRRCPEVLKYTVDPWVMNREGSNCDRFRL